MRRRFQINFRAFQCVADCFTKLGTWLVLLAVLFGWLLIYMIRATQPSQTVEGSQVLHLPESQRVADAREAFQGVFSRANVIRFLSWNGRWIGTDVDTEIELAADGSVRLTEYGDDVDVYKGTYSINESSELTLSLKGYLEGYPAVWPTMHVYRDNSMLLLAPADGSADLFQRQTGKAYGADGYWPFRQFVE